MLGVSVLALLSLFFFAAASFGFLYFMFKYAPRSETRLWGTRISLAMGFLGVAALVIAQGGMNQTSTLILVSLLVSLLGFELSNRFLS
jgi:hypothetical protein